MSAKNQLWNPSCGIRLSSRSNSQPRYPFLDMSRLLHATGFNGVAKPKLKLDAEEFGDDEELDRAATEWFDQQDANLNLASNLQNDNKVAPLDNVVEKTAHDETSGGMVEQVEPPVTSLDYNISEELFWKARQSKPESPESFWSYTMYRRVNEDGSEQNVKVHYCTTIKTMEHVCKRYFADEKVIGFDLEWMAYCRASDGVRKNISLVQIASPSRVGLFHLALFPKDNFIAPTFRAMMENPEVSKVGVNILADCTRLRNMLGVQTKGIFELSHLFKLVKYSREGKLNRINKTVVSLAEQAQAVFHLPIFKGTSVRTGDWMASLSNEQIMYSASDAYAGVQLYHILEGQRQKLDPCPPRPEFAEKGRPIRVAIPPGDDGDALLVKEPVSGPDFEEEHGPETEAVRSKVSTFGKASTTSSSRDRDPRIIVAEDKMKAHFSGSSKPISASPAALRAYFLWYGNDDLDPVSVAALLRDPPLKTNTVITYVMDAISLEGLHYSKERLRKEVLSLLAPDARISSKHKTLMQAAQDIGQK